MRKFGRVPVLEILCSVSVLLVLSGGQPDPDFVRSLLLNSRNRVVNALNSAQPDTPSAFLANYLEADLRKLFIDCFGDFALGYELAVAVWESGGPRLPPESANSKSAWTAPHRIFESWDASGKDCTEQLDAVAHMTCFEEGSAWGVHSIPDQRGRAGMQRSAVVAIWPTATSIMKAAFLKTMNSRRTSGRTSALDTGTVTKLRLTDNFSIGNKGEYFQDLRMRLVLIVPNETLGLSPSVFEKGLTTTKRVYSGVTCPDNKKTVQLVMLHPYQQIDSNRGPDAGVTHSFPLRQTIYNYLSQLPHAALPNEYLANGLWGVLQTTFNPSIASPLMPHLGMMTFAVHVTDLLADNSSPWTWHPGTLEPSAHNKRTGGAISMKVQVGQQEKHLMVAFWILSGYDQLQAVDNLKSQVGIELFLATAEGQVEKPMLGVGVTKAASKMYYPFPADIPPRAVLVQLDEPGPRYLHAPFGHVVEFRKLLPENLNDDPNHVFLQEVDVFVLPGL